MSFVLDCVCAKCNLEIDFEVIISFSMQKDLISKCSSITEMKLKVFFITIINNIYNLKDKASVRIYETPSISFEYLLQTLSNH